MEKWGGARVRHQSKKPFSFPFSFFFFSFAPDKSPERDHPPTKRARPWKFRRLGGRVTPEGKGSVSSSSLFVFVLFHFISFFLLLHNPQKPKYVQLGQKREMSSRSWVGAGVISVSRPSKIRAGSPSSPCTSTDAPSSVSSTASPSPSSKMMSWGAASEPSMTQRQEISG